MSLADKVYRNGYEHEFEYEILDMDGKPTGIKVWLMDVTCNAAVAVDERYRALATDMVFKHTGDEAPDGARGELYVKQEFDKYVACISKWDLAGESLLPDGDADPECNYENKSIMMRIPGINSQITGKINEISGFTKPLKKG